MYLNILKVNSKMKFAHNIDPSGVQRVRYLVYITAIALQLVGCKNNSLIESPALGSLNVRPILLSSDGLNGGPLHSMDERGNIGDTIALAGKNVLQAHWSPNGKSIAIVTEDLLNVRIFDVNGIIIYQDSIPYALYFVWAPDSYHFYIKQNDTPCAVLSYKISGGAADTVVPSSICYDVISSCSPDGKTLFGAAVPTGNIPGAGSHMTIYRMSVDDGKKHFYTLTGIGFSSAPIVSHNGLKIAFGGIDLHNKCHLYIMNIDGTGIKPIYNGNTNYSIPVGWSSDDSSILFGIAFGNTQLDEGFWHCLIYDLSLDNTTDITPPCSSWQFNLGHLPILSWRQ